MLAAFHSSIQPPCLSLCAAANVCISFSTGFKAFLNLLMIWKKEKRLYEKKNKWTDQEVQALLSLFAVDNIQCGLSSETKQSLWKNIETYLTDLKKERLKIFTTPPHLSLI